MTFLPTPPTPLTPKAKMHRCKRCGRCRFFLRLATIYAREAITVSSSTGNNTSRCRQSSVPVPRASWQASWCTPRTAWSAGQCLDGSVQAPARYSRDSYSSAGSWPPGNGVVWTNIPISHPSPHGWQSSLNVIIDGAKVDKKRDILIGICLIYFWQCNNNA